MVYIYISFSFILVLKNKRSIEFFVYILLIVPIFLKTKVCKVKPRQSHINLVLTQKYYQEERVSGLLHFYLHLKADTNITIKKHIPFLDVKWRNVRSFFWFRQ